MKLFDPFNVDFSGAHLIEASAGTGKTYNIASLYIRSIIEGRPAGEILVVTYTNAAAKELRDRLMQRIRESIQVLTGSDFGDDTFLAKLQNEITRKKEAVLKLKAALRRFDEAAVYTIHGFCQHVLQEYAFESGSPFSAELIGDDSDIIEEIVDDYWRNWVRENSNDKNRYPLLKFMIGQGYTPDKLAKELGKFTGKPYLKIQPKNLPDETDFDRTLNQLSESFESLKTLWSEQKEEIYSLLRSEQINGSKYRKDHLANWMSQMADFLNEEATPVQYFERFGKFCQSTVNESLKASTDKPPPCHPFFKEAEAYRKTADSLKQYEVFFKLRLFNHLLEKTDEKKEEQQVYSYDDLLVRLRNALREPPRGDNLRDKLRRAYPVALVDEFQDTDPVQYEIFKTIYTECKQTTLFMIGDPKQSIYSFRGADVFVYLKARGETREENRYSLAHNYRSTRQLLDAFNEFFGSSANPFLLDDISYQPVEAGRKDMKCLQIESEPDAPFVIRKLMTEEDDAPLNKEEAKHRAAQDAASQIKDLLDKIGSGKAKVGDKKIKAEDIAVLVRDHNQADLVKDELIKRGIHCVTNSNATVFETEEARQMVLILKAVAEPADERLAAAALSTSLFKYNGKDLFDLQENGTRWAEKLNQFYEWNQRWQQHGFSSFFQAMMQEESVTETAAKRRNGERILTNLTHLSSLIHREEKQSGRGIHALLKWFQKKRQEDRNEAEEEQLRLESDENLVQVITQHHSKGLEYPVVFCPFLWYVKQNRDDGSPVTYHDPDDMEQTILDLSGKDDPHRNEKRFAAEKEIMEESLRLAYVALTRAKQKCIVNWIYANDSELSPLSYWLLSKNRDYESFKDIGKNGADFSAQIQQSLDDLGKHSAILAESIKRNEEETKTTSDLSSRELLEAKEFHRSSALSRGKDMSSFSSLTQMNREVDFDTVEYYDQFLTDRRKSETKGAGIFGFPKGPEPGTAVHHIFENIDFSNDDNWKSVISEYLERENIDPKWQPVVYAMLQKTVSKPLLASKPSLRMAEILPEEMVAEMQFHFSNRHVELQDLLNIIRPDSQQEELLDNFADEGFMTGFIDLTFRFGGQYYIIDYKTNHLGNDVEDYSRQELDEAMAEHFYDLQYHLYLVALHRFLKQKLPDYDYKRHIGGVFYLFVRGINEKNDAGIYFDRPNEEKIDELNRYF